MIIVLYLCKGEMKMNKFLKGFVCALLVLSTGCAKEEKKETPKKTKKKTEKTAQITNTDITMSFVGDMTLGNYAGQAYDGSFDQEYAKQGNNPDYFLKNVKSVFEQDDLTIANLEGPLTDEESHVIKSFPFKGKKEYAKILTNSSVEAVTVANNHSMDRYQKGMDDTKATLDEYGVGYFGYEKSYIKEVKGIKFGFLGYAFPNAVSDDMKNAITELKKKTDFVVVYYHWGIERNYSPTQGQRDLAHATIDAGANMVVGSHPHVLEGIETYKDSPIVYSLSNFCFGGNRNPSDKDSMIYQQTFHFTNKKITSMEHKIIPCMISSVKYRNNYQPIIATGQDAERILKKVNTIQ